MKKGAQSCKSVKIAQYSIPFCVIMVVNANKSTDDKHTYSNYDMQKLQKSQARCTIYVVSDRT